MREKQASEWVLRKKRVRGSFSTPTGLSILPGQNVLFAQEAGGAHDEKHIRDAIAAVRNITKLKINTWNIFTAYCRFRASRNRAVQSVFPTSNFKLFTTSPYMGQRTHITAWHVTKRNILSVLKQPRNYWTMWKKKNMKMRTLPSRKFHFILLWMGTKLCKRLKRKLRLILKLLILRFMAVLSRMSRRIVFFFIYRNSYCL